jgi:hypothetical protein
MSQSTGESPVATLVFVIDRIYLRTARRHSNEKSLLRGEQCNETFDRTAIRLGVVHCSILSAVETS